MTSDAPVIGRRGKLSAHASEKERGLASFKVELIQYGKTHVLEEKVFQGELEHEIEVDIGKDAIPDLQEGEVVVRALAGLATPARSF